MKCKRWNDLVADDDFAQTPGDGAGFFNVWLMAETLQWCGFGRIFHFSGVSTAATVL
jgi:hypothetical protein